MFECEFLGACMCNKRLRACVIIGFIVLIMNSNFHLSSFLTMNKNGSCIISSSVIDRKQYNNEEEVNVIVKIEDSE